MNRHWAMQSFLKFSFLQKNLYTKTLTIYSKGIVDFVKPKLERKKKTVETRTEFSFSLHLYINSKYTICLRKLNFKIAISCSNLSLSKLSFLF